MVWTSLSQNMTSYCAMTILPIASEAAFHLPQRRRDLSELFKGLNKKMIVRASEMQRSACSMDQKRQTNALLFWLWWDSSPNMGILLNSPEREKIRSSRRRVVARVDEIIKPYDSSRHFHYNFQDGQQRRSAQYKGIFWVQIIRLLLNLKEPWTLNVS